MTPTQSVDLSSLRGAQRRWKTTIRWVRGNHEEKNPRVGLQVQDTLKQEPQGIVSRPRAEAWKRTQPQLPIELCTEILQAADLTPDALARCAFLLSKTETTLSAAASSTAVWKQWHPKQILVGSLSQSDHKFLVKEFFRRHQSYSIRAQLHLHRSRDVIICGDSFRTAAALMMLDAQNDYEIEEAYAWGKTAQNFNLFGPLQSYRLDAQNPFFVFDEAMAQLRNKPNADQTCCRILPEALRHEEVFLRRGLDIWPAWFSQLPDPQRQSPSLKAIAFFAVLRKLTNKASMSLGTDEFGFVPTDFFEDVTAMRDAIRIQPKIRAKASAAVKEQIRAISDRETFLGRV